MICKDVQSCIKEINAYCMSAPSGKVLFVNAENFNQYQKIKSLLEADKSKFVIYISGYCADNGLPNIDEAIDELSINKRTCALVGLSQASMLRGEDYINNVIGRLLDLPIFSYAIVLLDHCETYLRKYFSVHPDISKWVLLIDGNYSILPRIRLVTDADKCYEKITCQNMKSFFKYLEDIDDVKVSNTYNILVRSKFGMGVFKKSIYSVSLVDGIYETLSNGYSEISHGTEKYYGNDDNWLFLAEEYKTYGSLSAIDNAIFGSSQHLPSIIGSVKEENDKNKLWLLWLSLKIQGKTENQYLNIVLKNSKGVDEFEKHMVMDLLDFRYDDPNFEDYYFQRKKLLDSLPENISLIDQYCSIVGKYQKNAVYYLTDLTEKEELEFLKCVEKYDYTEKDLLKATSRNFPDLNAYIREYKFTEFNMKVADTGANLWEIFTKYFQAYKVQKITNHIDSEFLKEVEKFAEERPYNLLPARSSIISQIDKNNSQCYFFDALGAEYLSFIENRCEKYGLIVKISIAHCELPSITSKNKEFIKYFPEGVRDIKELDELKHHSQDIDYQHCKEPIHIFRELEIIDKELRKVQSELKQDHFKKAIIVSDHGASRLAVIHEQENGLLQLDEKGEHSGRCCKVDYDPNIPYASYWDGYSILANYDRFKGGRKANVEVHGGASLEEVLVPIIEIKPAPIDIVIQFTPSVITVQGKEPISVTIYSNVPLHKPELFVSGNRYAGEFCEDKQHVQFILADIPRRNKEWLADVYDNDERLVSGLTFKIQKKTQEQNLFKKQFF